MTEDRNTQWVNRIAVYQQVVERDGRNYQAGDQRWCKKKPQICPVALSCQAEKLIGAQEDKPDRPNNAELWFYVGGHGKGC